MGGSDSAGNMLDTVEVFTPGQTCTKTLAPMPVPSSDPVVGVIAGIILNELDWIKPAQPNLTLHINIQTWPDLTYPILTQSNLT